MSELKYEEAVVILTKLEEMLNEWIERLSKDKDNTND